MMDTVVSRKLYESMFLVDSAQASDWDGTISIIEGLLKKSGGEIVSIKKWDERRLAYEIERKTRGMYILCYFNADGDKIQDIEKSVQLSEPILRVLILSTEQMSTEDIERDTPATKLAKDEAARQAAIKAKQEEAAAAAAAAEAAQSGDGEAAAAVEGEAGAGADADAVADVDADAVATADAGVSEPGDVVADGVAEAEASEASTGAEEADSTEPAEESKESQVDEAGEASAEAEAEAETEAKAPEEQDL